MPLKEAVFAVQAEIFKVQKDGINPHHKKGYVTLEAVLEALNEPLQTNKIVVTQTTRISEGQWVLATNICLSDNKECESFDTPLLGLGDSKNPMQAFGSAVTYARRYALLNYFKLAPTDDDGEDVGAAALSVTKEKRPHQKPENKVQDLKIADGKFKGMWVSEVPPEDLKSYIKTIEVALAEAGGVAPKWFLDLKKAAG